jgi:hypothetical protein
MLADENDMKERNERKKRVEGEEGRGEGLNTRSRGGFA